MSAKFLVFAFLTSSFVLCWAHEGQSPKAELEDVQQNFSHIGSSITRSREGNIVIDLSDSDRVLELVKNENVEGSQLAPDGFHNRLYTENSGYISSEKNSKPYHSENSFVEVGVLQPRDMPRKRHDSIWNIGGEYEKEIPENVSSPGKGSRKNSNRVGLTSETDGYADTRTRVWRIRNILGPIARLLRPVRDFKYWADYRVSDAFREFLASLVRTGYVLGNVKDGILSAFRPIPVHKEGGLWKQHSFPSELAKERTSKSSISQHSANNYQHSSPKNLGKTHLSLKIRKSASEKEEYGEHFHGDRDESNFFGYDGKKAVLSKRIYPAIERRVKEGSFGKDRTNHFEGPGLKAIQDAHVGNEKNKSPKNKGGYPARKNIPMPFSTAIQMGTEGEKRKDARRFVRRMQSDKNNKAIRAGMRNYFHISEDVPSSSYDTKKVDSKNPALYENVGHLSAMKDRIDRLVEKSKSGNSMEGKTDEFSDIGREKKSKLSHIRNTKKIKALKDSSIQIGNNFELRNVFFHSRKKDNTELKSDTRYVKHFGGKENSDVKLGEKVEGGQSILVHHDLGGHKEEKSSAHDKGQILVTNTGDAHLTQKVASTKHDHDHHVDSSKGGKSGTVNIKLDLEKRADNVKIGDTLNHNVGKNDHVYVSKKFESEKHSE